MLIIFKSRLTEFDMKGDIKLYFICISVKIMFHFTSPLPPFNPPGTSADS